MALTAVQTVMNLEGPKSVHPFFAKPSKNACPESSESHDAPSAPSADDALEDEPVTDDAKGSKGRGKRRRKNEGVKGKKDAGAGSKTQASLEGFTRRADVPAEAESLDEDPNRNRRKRRKTATPPRSAPAESDGLEWHQQLQLEAVKTDEVLEEPRKQTAVGGDGLPEIITESVVEARGVDTRTSNDVPRDPSLPLPGSLEDTTAPVELVGDILRPSTPKKIIKITKNGKLLSSSPTKPVVEPVASPKRRRGRPRKQTKSSPTVTVIRYGVDAEGRERIGQKIQTILSGEDAERQKPPTPAKAKAKPKGPPKPTHPFFTGKSAQGKDDTAGKAVSENPTATAPRTPRKSAVTPGKLRAERWSMQSPKESLAFDSMGTERRKPYPGTNDAPWPSQDNAHVRNIEDFGSISKWPLPQNNGHRKKPRKLKGNVFSVPWNANLLNSLAQEMRAFRTIQDAPVEDFPKPDNVRLPQRLLTTGVTIQEQVRKQIKASLVGVAAKDTHPAVETLSSEIEHTLTPFDKGDCEFQSWTQKYAPRLASHVLQSGREATVLRDWLQSLTVKTVESGKDQKSANGVESKAPPRKKRKKDVDDFVVFSDEEGEDEELVELAGNEERFETLFGSRRAPSLIRPTMSRNKNVVLISGPHGCGKTATVYAVAKELGFEVFEINSGSRRSGKDIQDRVGDMSENHLVSHKRSEVKIKEDAIVADDTDNERNSKAFQKDLDSGRQGTMMSFFSAKARSKVEQKPKPKAKVKETLKSTSAAQATLPILQQPRKSQKQSLILFEEADVLFEEDAQFWAQVIKLASQSKRPIIITCNNETQIPTQALPLAAVLRLSSPPPDLACDYMLALAAREGHLIERQAVRMLFDSNSGDLRSSIAALDFWCQMSVGDTKGGLDWIYQRWPPGKDVDEHGRLLRVASQGTYVPGMGLVSHDIAIITQTTGFDKEEELLRGVWRDWSIRPDEMGPDCTHRDFEKGTSNDPLERLKRLDAVSEAVSAADIYCRIGLPSYTGDYEEPADPTLPPIPEKSRLSYTAEAPLLQFDPRLDFSNTGTKLFVQSHLARQRAFGGLGLEPNPNHASTTGFNTEERLAKSIIHSKQNQTQQTTTPLSRPSFSTAFDILASPPSTSSTLSSSSTGPYPLTATSFDRTFAIVVQDLAPYIRSIVSYELRLEAQRLRLSNLLSEGGKGKRPRTTRASRVALEGGTRDTKRRERWFDGELNRTLVMATAGSTWTGMGSCVDEGEGDATSVTASQTAESLVGTQEAGGSLVSS